MVKPLKKVKPSPTESVVKPSVTFLGGKDHVLEELLKKDEAQELKSVGYARVNNLAGHTAAYVSYVITTKGDKVLKIEVEEPNLKAIAEEATKISFVNNFMTGDM